MAIDSLQAQGLVHAQTQKPIIVASHSPVMPKPVDTDHLDKALPKKEDEFSLLGDDGLSFWDVLDVINPLQHIPIVNSIYREITGDEIDPAAKLAGGTLFGGVFGLVAAAVDVAIDGLTGKDLGEHAFALINGETDETADGNPTAIANAESSKDTEQTLAAVIPPSPRQASPAAQSAAIAATGAATIAAAQSMPSTGSKQDETLPDWNAAPQVAAAKVPSVAGLTAPTIPNPPSGKVFPVPTRRHDMQNVRSVAQLRAQTEVRATSVGSLTTSPNLSPATMRAAGVNQETLDEIKKIQGNIINDDMQAIQNIADKSSEMKPADGPVGLNNAWMYNSMNQALDKYKAAETLKTKSSNGTTIARES